nr:hypothetical protein [Tanacetum cinerariifolium]
MVKFTYFKVKGKLTDSIFNEMLEFFQKVFPTTKGYKLPPSYYVIKKTFKTIRLGYESIYTCVNDCFLFQGEDYKDKQLCPVCNTSRWKDSNTPGKKVPKVLRYFLIILRLQHLYKSSHTTKEMTWHATRKCTKPSKMQHPIDGRAWKNFDTKYSNFAKEPRNNVAGDHSAHWANLLEEIVREFPMHFGSWRSIPSERKAEVLRKIGPHMQSELWPDIRNGIDQHLGKIYMDNKSSLKKDYWVKNPDDETYDVKAIRSQRPTNIFVEDWDAQIRFWSDPKNMAWCAQNAHNRAKSMVVCWQGSQTLAALRDMQMQSSATQEYPSLIQTFFDTHTVGGVFLWDEDRHLYVRGDGDAIGSRHYTDDQIMAMVRRGKQHEHISGIDRVLAGRGKDVLDVLVPRCNHTSNVNEFKRSNKHLQKHIDMITKAMSSDDMYS